VTLNGALAFLAASMAAAGIGASLDSPRSLMARYDYSLARGALDAEARLALARCRALEGFEKSVCRTAAHADDRVRRAELEARYRGTVEAESELTAAREKATLEIARAKRDYLKL
jgi:hypothetical protein